MGLSVVFRHRQIERGKHDRKILKREFLDGEMKAVPVGKRRWNDAIARNSSILIQPHPVKCAATRRFDTTQRRTCAKLKRFTNAATSQGGNGLFHDANRLFRFGEQNSQPRVAVAFLLAGYI